MFSFDKPHKQELSKNKIKETINQTNLVPTTFLVLISKERNSKKVSRKNDIRRKNTCVKILMGSGASASIIHESYVNKNNFIVRKKRPRISGPQWLDIFLRYARPKLRLK